MDTNEFGDGGRLRPTDRGNGRVMGRRKGGRRAGVRQNFVLPGVSSMWVVSINHTTAPVQVRGRFAIPADGLEAALESLRRSVPHSELVLLSTCSRTEIYCAGSDQGIEPAFAWLAAMGRTSMDRLRPFSFALQDGMMARHAFRVASGLESMVVGEPQILGQLKVAVGLADAVGSLGITLNQLFQRSFATAKEVRSSTALGEHSISMAAAAVRVAGKLFPDLRGCRVLLIGAGEMIGLVATHFAARKPASMTVVNRTAARGEALAAKLGGNSMALGDLVTRLHEFDVVISCTASPIPILQLSAVQRAMQTRGHRQMVFVDLAVPNDVEPDVRAVQDVHLYTVDDLCRIVEAGKGSRNAAVAGAESIVESGVREFDRWRQQRDAVPLIQRLIVHVEAWRCLEIEKARKLASKHGADAALDYLSTRLVGKLLHGAMHELNSTRGDAYESASAAVRRFFLRDELLNAQRPDERDRGCVGPPAESDRRVLAETVGRSGSQG